MLFDLIKHHYQVEVEATPTAVAGEGTRTEEVEGGVELGSATHSKKVKRWIAIAILIIQRTFLNIYMFQDHLY
jgi:hypothetical protein